MPITCAIDFKPLPTIAFGALDYQVMEKRLPRTNISVALPINAFTNPIRQWAR